jgi:rare lipoprotein A
MTVSAPARHRQAFKIALAATSALLLTACAAQQSKVSSGTKKPRSKEYFAESVYGVKASPRVTYAKGRLPRGGGRDQTGKPYMVRGKMYYPKEEKSYRKTGLASWYGSAFHGRLTANGEVYDMAHLTAAHPTMPLPSYARVTNLENGSSVIVRVNDRGPYHEGRLIDLSQKAAEMLGYTRTGTAKVQVDYVGRAPLDGEDDSYLMASYKPGKAIPDPSDGLPTGVMIAMNGPTPSVGLGTAAQARAFPGTLNDSAPMPTPRAPMPAVAEMPDAPFQTASASGSADVLLPDFGPIIPQRPDVLTAHSGKAGSPVMSYASGAMVRPAVAALEAFGSTAPMPEPAEEAFVAAGTFSDAEQAKAVASALDSLGRTTVKADDATGTTLFSVAVYADGRASLDAVLEAAWSHGAPDAMTVRD